MLKKRVIKLEAGNGKLKQIIQEIANLKIKNAKLKQIIKQNRTTNYASQTSVSPALSVIPSPTNGYSDKDNSTNSVNLEQAQSDTPEKFVSPKINSNNTREQMPQESAPKGA